MQKSIRVYELAKALGVKSKDILAILRDKMDIEVKNHMSSINDQVASRVRGILTGEPEPAPETGAEEPASPPEEKAPAGRAAAEKGPAPADKKSSRPSGRRSSKTDSPARERSGGRGRPGRKQALPQEVEITGPMTVAQAAALLNIEASAAVRKLVSQGVMASVNQTLTVEQVADLCREMGVEPRVNELPEQDPLLSLIEETDASREVSRWPVVTVLGHVDHGKTTLLDHIRKTRVQAGEAGGITQHIGASRVRVGEQRIVFLDTPGHEAFTAMRARGARVTDVAVLVVACDDGVKPQTVEALNHAREAEVPVVVALNKIDVEGANPDRVRQQLSDLGLLPEDWGGDTVMVPVSALSGQGVDELLEMIVLVAQMQDLKADPVKRAHGTVIDARLDRARGSVATVLVQEGTLRRGDPILAGVCPGRVRAMVDDAGRAVKEAGPSMPVEVLGLSGVPEAGDRFVVASDEKEARSLAETLQDQRRTEEISIQRPVTLSDFFDRLKEEEQQELKLILKAEVHGSLEALRESLEKLKVEEIAVRVIHGGVGAISESDIMLASASGAIIIGYNVVPDANARRTREREGVDVRTYRVIYEIIDDVKAALTGLLKPEIKEEILGRAAVRATFRVPDLGLVAGCYVTEGRIRRNARIRILRDGVVLHEGQISSLRRFKDDVREVVAGYECGLGLTNWHDIEEGDELEIFVEREVRREPAV